MNKIELRNRLEQVMMCNIPKLEGKEELLKQNHTKLADDLQMDSFDIVTLQVALEEMFLFEFNPLEDDFVGIFENMDSLEKFLCLKCGVE